MTKSVIKAAFLCLALTLAACASEQKEENQESIFEVKKPKATYGKIQKVDVGPTIDATMAKAGKETFEIKCGACHKYDERYVGPALGKVTERRTPEYVMNMILDTETMIENDDTVKCLVQEFMMRMPNQSVDEKDARAVLEHLRDYAEHHK
ncbi:MAG: cytochrome c [Bradyrhizobiaceae bacterium]|nr:cytochrome c [Bradyrhizobiaceae bacterium]